MVKVDVIIVFGVVVYDVKLLLVFEECICYGLDFYEV